MEGYFWTSKDLCTDITKICPNTGNLVFLFLIFTQTGLQLVQNQPQKEKKKAAKKSQNGLKTDLSFRPMTSAKNEVCIHSKEDLNDTSVQLPSSLKPQRKDTVTPWLAKRKNAPSCSQLLLKNKSTPTPWATGDPNIQHWGISTFSRNQCGSTRE